MVVPRSVTKILEAQIARLDGVQTAASEQAAKIIKRSLAIQNSLGEVREPLKKRAEAEQRNTKWLESETQNAFGAKVRDIARLRFEADQLKSALSASKPSLPPIDRSDFLGAMEVIAVAQRVATSKNYQELSPAERVAALRVPTLAKLPPSIVEHWTDEAIAATDPDRMATYKQDLETIRSAEGALDIVTQSLQQEAGFVDNTTGAPSPSWGSFERVHTEPIRKEMEAKERERQHGRAVDAVEKAKDALRAAESERFRKEIEFLKNMQ
jgi:hypothetical protein